jgi:hypothetical protein
MENEVNTLPTEGELTRRIKELQAEVATLTQLKVKVLTERREAVLRQWKFTFAPSARTHILDRLRLGSGCMLFSLTGEVVNKVACIEAGYSTDEVGGGAMEYVVNMLNGKIVMSSGGGCQFIQDRCFNANAQEEAKADVERVFSALEEELARLAIHKAHPALLHEMIRSWRWIEPLDVTSIILNQRHFGWR